MGLPVTVYRWDDAGAPQITDTTPKTWIDIFKACLVNGYGNKAPAGWTIPFEDLNANKVVFRNSTSDGSGGCIQFWSVSGGNSPSDVLVYKAAKSMPNLDTFVRPCFTEVWKGSSSQASYTQWMIIATSISFYAFALVGNVTTVTKGSYSIFVGDIDSFTPNDAGRFIGGAAGISDRLSDSSISPNYQSLLYNETFNLLPKLYETDGGGSFTISSGCTSVRSVSSVMSTTGDDDLPVPLVLYDVMLYGSNAVDSVGNDSVVSQLQPLLRGKVVGVRESLFRGNMVRSFPHIRQINGVNHMLMPTMIGVIPKYWLNIEEWY